MNTTPVKKDIYFDLTPYIIEETRTYVKYKLPEYIYYL